MCRFLIVKSKDKIRPENFLKPFSEVTQKSVAPDGETQKDGFGIAWKNNGKWEVQKSLKPIWEEHDTFEKIPETDFLVAHARGAGFAQDRGEIEYNEPFIEGDSCFVFNGIIRKVKLDMTLEGKIGSQKIFSLLKMYFKKNPDTALQTVNDLILEKSEKIEGMNIGLITKDKIYVLNQYDSNEDYYGLHYFENERQTIISSEKFGDYKWNKFKKGKVHVFQVDH